MKRKLAIILLFVTFGIQAQKELQPYNFSLSDNGKTETIMIYASAEAVNSITFTLKNEKNENLKTKNDNDEKLDITFKVFPFTENSFRSHLVDAINSIVEKDETNKEYEIFKTTLAPLKKVEANYKKKEDDESKEKLANQLSKRKNAVQSVRNIFQFFNALVITAFQYDTEPVAGILKYKQEAIAEEQNIDGLNTEEYFKNQTKFIRDLILSSDDKNDFKNSLNDGGSNNLKGDDFLLFLAKKVIIKDEDERVFRDYEDELKKEIKCIKEQDRYKTPLIIEKIAKLNISIWGKCSEKDNYSLNQQISNIERELIAIENSLNNNTFVNIESLEKEVKKIENQINKKVSYEQEGLTKIKNRLNNLKKLIERQKESDRLIKNIEEDSYLISLYDYYQNITRGNNNNIRKTLKIHIRKKIEEWYDIYKLKKFVKNSFANNYFKEKYRKTLSEEIINEYSELIDKDKAKRETLEKELEIVEKKADSLNNLIKKEAEIIDKYSGKDSKTNEDYSKRKTQLETLKAKLEGLIIDKKRGLKNIKHNIPIYKDSLKQYEEKVKYYQNKINFLIAENKDQIVDTPWWKFNITNIEIDFNDGFIEHITVTSTAIHPEIDKTAILNSIKKRHEKYYTNVSIEKAFKEFYQEPSVVDIFKDKINKEFKFDNEFPIGFSSKADFADLSDYHLYAFKGKKRLFSLLLSDVINLYVQRHQNDRLDFSPRDQVLRLPLDDTDKNNEVELKKEKSYKILNAKIFTDFNGFKESEPNGLVQTEIEKFIPIWTKRFDLGIGRSSNYGFFNYANFNFTWAKLNEEDRELQVLKTENFVNNESQIYNYISYLDLIRFENISVGVDLNIASFDFPLVKTRIELNAGVHYSRVKIIDDIPNPTDENPEATIRQLEKDVNMIRLYPDVIVRIRPEERFGGYLRFRPFRTIVPDNDEFFTVYSADDFLDDPNDRQNALEDQRWLQRYELGAFYTPSADSDNKFFFRYRYTNTSKWLTNGYSEIQLGYQIYLKF